MKVVHYRTFTAEMAAKVFQKNSKRQRRVSRPTVDRYKAVMQAGKWVPGSVIHEGQDGQQRLIAQLELGISLPDVIVVHDTPAEWFAVEGEQKRRTFADVVYIAGHDNETALASALPVIWRCLNGCPTDRCKSTDRRTLLALIDSFVVASVEATVAFRAATKRRLLPVGIQAGLHYIFSKQAGQQRADRFFEALQSGATKLRGILDARNKIVGYADHQHAVLTYKARMEVLLEAWESSRKRL